MRTARTVGLGFGIVFLLGVGAVSLSRAQQAEEKAAAPPPARGVLRERLLTLRTELDVLQLEFDADRATLVEWLAGTSKADLMGIDMSALLGTMKLEFGGVTGNFEALKEMSDLSKLMEDKPGEAPQVMQKVLAKGKDDLKKALQSKKQEFAKKARFLNEKKLELEETVAKYAAALKS